MQHQAGRYWEGWGAAGPHCTSAGPQNLESLILDIHGRWCPQELARSRDGLEYFLTYADNAAVGYFEKQGFSTRLTLPRDRVRPSSAGEACLGVAAP